MALDVSSFSAYVRSLNIKVPVTTRPRRSIAGPPTAILELVLRLGLGPLIFNTRRNRELMANLGLDSETLCAVTERLRTRGKWLEVWEELAQPHIEAAKRAAAAGEAKTALQDLRSALLMLSIGLCGDGHYFYSPMEARWTTYPLRRRLYALHRKITRARTERLNLTYPNGQTRGLLNFPPGHSQRSPRVPALVGLHPLSTDKESFDYCLRHFRDAGYATLCVDLPAHGENFHGPRLRADSEWVALAALEALRQHPRIDPDRLGLIGGSLGAYYMLRAAAASSMARACVAFSAPFDLSVLGPAMRPGVVENFAWAVGAKTRDELIARCKEFHLHEIVEQVQCPVCLLHGTQDTICDFSSTYEIISRLKAPGTVIPLVGVDHEASYPELPHIAAPAVEWLKQHL
jgi:alpha-beta hydrolase superfamily lysophospholipase